MRDRRRSSICTDSASVASVARTFTQESMWRCNRRNADRHSLARKLTDSEPTEEEAAPVCPNEPPGAPICPSEAPGAPICPKDPPPGEVQACYLTHSASTSSPDYLPTDHQALQLLQGWRLQEELESPLGGSERSVSLALLPLLRETSKIERDGGLDAAGRSKAANTFARHIGRLTRSDVPGWIGEGLACRPFFLLPE